MTKIKTIKPNFSDLSSRDLGSQYRQETVQAIKSGNRIVFDFSKVDSASPSFADELFGVLAESLGLEVLQNSVRLVEADEDVLDSILDAISYRLENKRDIVA